ncbi:beta-ketoacyl synthase N-terminal-like domain-containing protein [Brevibacillus sp. HD1.4A]|uniref:beta-ketoacyl synthase N-terminal-like domain-containing protein n=1 Tax=Brevibacillus sp. HD1.4A TaxID=2738978 RepID=UPI00156A7790|nr:beta-ketoacyl synthase N-terminal-like domain-containing protein [Brevibacillus sp. HD1.4A]NRQ55275.1 6-deoxyerythronolide-B synthase [Brevibacillus sp. HD1.4A]
MENAHALSEKIAIIGMAGKFPQAENIQRYWHNLVEGVEGIRFFTKEELLESGVDPALLDRPDYVPACGQLTEIEWFDAAFFQYTPREAEIIDPQQRLFLEAAWNALEDAGQSVSQLDGAVGVFAGIGANKYLTHVVSRPDLLRILDHRQIEVGNDKDFLTTRVSYKLNLTGPSFSVQTACSSSLVSVHLACQSLLNGECDMALAGGVSVQFLGKHGYLYKQGGIESPDGHCRCFDEKAEGTVFGDGVGVIVLKRLDEAIQDKDHIYAVISGSAINNDGAGKVGYTAPGFEGQIQVISEAMEVAGVTPHEIGYVEAHGTGTKLGDRVEMAALKEVFKERDPADPCYIGSVKANVGHLNTASGIAGLIKTVLAIHHETIPPLLHLQKPNPQLELENSPFRLNNTPVSWRAEASKRVAGVSSFGIGGTNAHVIVEAPPAMHFREEANEWQLLTISGKTSAARQRNYENVLAFLRENPQINLAQVAYTLQTGRESFDFRGIVLCHGQEALAHPEKLRFVCNEIEGSAEEKAVVFVFSPAGSATHGDLYQQIPFLREQMNQCFRFAERMFRLDANAMLDNDSPHGTIALFILEYSLAQLWLHWGVTPKAMAGDWLGEYVSACLAGVLAWEDALQLLFFRGDFHADIALAQPTIPFLSNRSGTWITEEQATSLDYWRELVGLSGQGMDVASLPALAQVKKPVFLEVGPGNKQLERLAASEQFHSAPLLSSLPASTESESACKTLLGSLGRLWLYKASINWKNVHAPQHPRRLPLPTYAFDRQYYWIERSFAAPVDTSGSEKRLSPSALLIKQGEQFIRDGQASYTLNALQMRQLEELLASFSTDSPAEKLAPLASASAPAQPPRQQRQEDMAAWLCTILEELLGKKPIGVHDDFFDLGGDSVTAIQFASRLKEQQIEIASDLLFDYSTMEELAKQIRLESDSQPSTEAVAGEDLTIQEQQARQISLESNSESSGNALPDVTPGTLFFSIGQADQEILRGTVDAQEVESVYPLTFMQLLVLNHNILHARQGTVNVLSFPIAEELRLHDFRMAWQRVIDRHSVLRTGFIWRRISNPVQFVKRQVEVSIDVLDWTKLSEAEQQRALGEWIAEERQKNFKVDEVPQMRFQLIQYSKASYQFVWTYQNSLFDGWSMNLILQEVWANYQLGESLISEPHMQATPFLDYVKWQKRQDDQEAKRFWTEELGKFRYQEQFVQTTPSQRNSYVSAVKSVALAQDEVYTVREFSRKNQLTINTVVLGAWGLAQARLFAQHDVLIGMITSGRVPEIEQMDKMVGLFTNSLPVRLTYSDTDQVKAWFVALQKKIVTIRRYEYITLQQIAQWSQIPLDFLQTVINTRSLVYTHFPFQGQAGEQRPFQAESSGQLHLPLRLFVNPGEEHFTIRAEYDSNQFAHDTVAQLLDEVKRLLVAIPSVDGVADLWAEAKNQIK